MKELYLISSLDFTQLSQIPVLSKFHSIMLEPLN